MRFSTKPISPVLGDVTEFVKNAKYLREALHKRLTEREGSEVEHEFQVQVRSAKSLAGAIDTEIEDARVDWAKRNIPSSHPQESLFPPKIAPRQSGRSYANDLASRHGMDFSNIALSVALVVSGAQCKRLQCALEQFR
jgi:hypothetical protein